VQRDREYQHNQFKDDQRVRQRHEDSLLEYFVLPWTVGEV
jgi:hypothetical protein